MVFAGCCSQSQLFCVACIEVVLRQMMMMMMALLPSGHLPADAKEWIRYLAPEKCSDRPVNPLWIRKPLAPESTKVACCCLSLSMCSGNDTSLVHGVQLFSMFCVSFNRRETGLILSREAHTCNFAVESHCATGPVCSFGSVGDSLQGVISRCVRTELMI